jgi:hypothetical protein
MSDDWSRKPRRSNRAAGQQLACSSDVKTRLTLPFPASAYSQVGERCPSNDQSRSSSGLLADIQRELVEEAQRRVHAAGYADIRATHDCVSRFLDGEGVRLRDLVGEARMTPQSVRGHVDELEGLGYIERVPDPPIAGRSSSAQPSRAAR